MKLILATLTLATITGSNVLAAEVKSATVNQQAGTVTVVVESAQYCNQPMFDLVYTMSGRASFGPYHFELRETPVGRMRCQGTQEISLVFGLQKITECRSNYRVALIKGDNATSAQLELNRPQP